MKLLYKTTNFVNESHLLIWGKLQLGLTRQTAREPSIYVFFKVGPYQSSLIYYDPFTKHIKHTIKQTNFLPPLGFEPGSP